MTLDQLSTEIVRFRNQAAIARQHGNIRLYLLLASEADKLSDDYRDLAMPEAHVIARAGTPHKKHRERV